MLSPKRTKYRKVQKGILKGKAQRGTKVTDGEYGIQALEPAWITESRMGSGKGNPEYFVAAVKPGRILFEISGLDEATSKEVLAKAIHKLPIRCKIVKREDQEGGVQ
mgnify:CR=1 FL=1